MLAMTSATTSSSPLFQASARVGTFLSASRCSCLSLFVLILDLLQSNSTILTRRSVHSKLASPSMMTGRPGLSLSALESVYPDFPSVLHSSTCLEVPPIVSDTVHSETFLFLRVLARLGFLLPVPDNSLLGATSVPRSLACLGLKGRPTPDRLWKRFGLNLEMLKTLRC